MKQKYKVGDKVALRRSQPLWNGCEMPAGTVLEIIDRQKSQLPPYCEILKLIRVYEDGSWGDVTDSDNLRWFSVNEANKHTRPLPVDEPVYLEKDDEDE